MAELTQEELARRTSVGPEQIARYETGVNKPSTEVLERLNHVIPGSLLFDEHMRSAVRRLSLEKRRRFFELVLNGHSANMVIYAAR